MIKSDEIKKSVSIAQHKQICVPLDSIPFNKRADLADLANSFSPLVEMTLDWHTDSLIIKSGAKVGVLTANGIRIQVLPWVSSGMFTDFLRYSLAGKIPPRDFRVHVDLDHEAGFEDSLGNLLANETREILKIGVSRKYTQIREPLNVVRGRPLWSCCFPWLEDVSASIVCHYHRMTYDNIDNRLILAGLRRAANMVCDYQVQRQLLLYLHGFRQLATEAAPGISDFEKARQGYNRLNDHYRCAHSLAQMFLWGLRPESFFEGGREVVGGFSLDMAPLFEKFVERFLSDLLEPDGFQVIPQVPDRGALLDGQGGEYASLRPDLMIRRGQELIAVVDAKYRPYWEAANAAGGL